MEPQVKEPKRAHTKSISVTSTMSREIVDTTKAPQRAKKFGSGKHAAVELDPQPTDSPQDPLVRPSTLSNDDLTNTKLELATMEEGTCIRVSAFRNRGC